MFLVPLDGSRERTLQTPGRPPAQLGVGLAAAEDERLRLLGGMFLNGPVRAGAVNPPLRSVRPEPREFIDDIGDGNGIFFRRPEKVGTQVALVLDGLYLGGAQLKAALAFNAYPLGN